MSKHIHMHIHINEYYLERVLSAAEKQLASGVQQPLYITEEVGEAD